MRRRKQQTAATPPTDERAVATDVYFTPVIAFAYNNRVYQPGDHLAEDDPIVAKVGKAAFYRVYDV